MNKRIICMTSECNNKIWRNVFCKKCFNKRKELGYKDE